MTRNCSESCAAAASPMSTAATPTSGRTRLRRQPMAEKKPYKRAPSPRVCAAKVLLAVLLNTDQFPTPEELTCLMRSQVTARKRAKIKAQVDKFAARLVERCRKIVHRYEHPNPAAVAKAKAMAARRQQKEPQ